MQSGGVSLQLVSPIEEKKCECGCGEFPKKGNRFITGHNSRIMSEEIRKKISKSKQGVSPSQETIEKRKVALKGRPAWNKGIPWTEKQRASILPRLIESNKREEVRKRISLSLKGRFTGENHPNWNGGSSFFPYPLEWSDELKKYIRDRDNNECQNPYCEHKTKRLHVHHIDYNKQNCSQFNLITLCRTCHARTISNRGHWKEFYNKIVWSKYL